MKFDMAIEQLLILLYPDCKELLSLLEIRNVVAWLKKDGKTNLFLDFR